MNAPNEMWGRFPDDAASKKMFAEIRGIAREGGKSVTPFQFTLGVMERLYSSLSNSDVNSINAEQALVNPIRAIAFFSWENETRVFLTRRCVPSFFGFLSYSHVPEGWGALGCALEEIRRDSGNYKGFSKILDITRKEVLLPYLREAHRLKYKTVLVLPIFKRNQSINVDNLLGAFVFYLPSENSLPADGDMETKGRLVCFVAKMSEALEKHYEALRGTLSDKGWDDSLKFGENYTGELIIKLHKEGDLDGLKKLSEKILTLLTGFDFHALRLNSTDERVSRIAVARRSGLARATFEAEILNVVGMACHHCSCEEYISYQFKLPSAFEKKET